MQATAPANNGQGLVGKELVVFDRSRNKSETFIQEFELYAHVNEDNHAFVQPFKRIFLVLSYMKGPKVNDWVRLMREQTILRVNGAPNNNPPIPPVNHRDDNALWDWFTVAYQNAFTDTTKSKDALTRLLAIKMQGNDLDTYIATFDHLWETA